jgi:peroxiredoxin
MGGVAAVFAALGAAIAWHRIAPTEADVAAVDLLFSRTLKDPSGAEVALADFRGKTVVVNFWATWCTPCVEEMPELAMLHDEIASRNATVLGIGIDSPSKIREFVERNRFSYPLLVGGVDGTELGRQLGNPSGALPYTVVIDEKGRVIERKLGRIRLDRLRSQVLAVLPPTAR